MSKPGIYRNKPTCTMGSLFQMHGSVDTQAGLPGMTGPAGPGPAAAQGHWQLLALSVKVELEPLYVSSR